MELIDRFRSFLEFEQNRSPHTVREYTNDALEFATFITGGKPERFHAESITTSDIRTWLAARGKEIGPRSMRRKLQSLRAMFRYLMKREGLAVNPADEIQPAKIPRTLPKFIKADDMEEVLATQRNDMPEWMNLRNNLIIDILYSCGLRRAELVSLNDNDIRFAAAEMRVTGKGNKTRIIPLPPQLLEKIRNWQRVRDSKWGIAEQEPSPLFRTSQGRIATSTIERITSKMLAGTRGDATNPHSLRHSFATAMLDGGADINSVKEFLGHSSIATTQIYTHVSFEQMRKAYTSAHPRAKSNCGKDPETE